MQSKKREGEGAGGVNHRKVTAANGGCMQTFSGAHTAFSALLVHSEVSLGVSGPVCLPAGLSIAFFGFLGSPSALPSPSLDVASTLR